MLCTYKPFWFRASRLALLTLTAGLCASSVVFAEESPVSQLVSPSTAVALAPGASGNSNSGSGTGIVPGTGTSGSSIGGAAIKTASPASTASASAAVAAAMNAMAASGASSASSAKAEVARVDHVSDAKTGGDSIKLSGPPPASAFSTDPNVLTQQAEDAAASAEAEAQRREQEHNAKSFERAEKGLLPLSPDQIRDFMRRLEITQQASQPPSGGPPKAEVKIATLSLDPGAQPPQINLVAGYVTTINMVDITGEPWPILDVGVGGSFEVTPTQSGSHVIRIVPLSRQASGNLSVLLRDLPTPVIFRLASGSDSVHMRFDARIPKSGPNAKAQIINQGRHAPTAGDEVIMAILQNSPPAAAKRLKISGLDARTMAWQLDAKIFVRTPLQLLSPAWNASVSSTDGMTVYEIGDAPVLLVSENGAMVRAHLLREDEHDNK